MVDGRASVDTALRRYGAFSARHRWQFESMLGVQKLVPRIPPRALAMALRAMECGSFTHWAFGHYLNIAHPSFASPAIPAPARPAELELAA